MYTVKRKTVFTKSIKDGSIQTCYLMHITVDTVADIPDAKENWLAGSRCDVLEDGGHVYALSNGREWVEVNFYNLGGESDSTDLSNYYTMSQTDERLLEIEEKILDNINNVGQFHLVDDEVKGEIFNDYANNVASGQYSHAEGYYTTASGDYAHAEGAYTIARGNYSHVEGWNNVASGTYAHAEGGYNKSVSGNYSHAEGFYNSALKLCSHAEGGYCTANGEYSHAEGYYSSANGNYSHAEGRGTASGDYAHAEGYYTVASGNYSHVEGKYNVQDFNNKYAFIIGNGTSINNRSNAFSIDWNGNIYVNNSDTPVNVLDLLNRISVLESKIAEFENSAST